ncbi:ABC transporter ATP-binding protein [bacterium]|nr:ABC transporter ATP-binding protein [bacterium]
MLSYRHISFAWHEKILLDDISANLSSGDIVWLTGGNGAGKSTLLKLAAGMIPHFNHGRLYEGDVEVLGRSIREHPPKSFYPQLAYVPSRNLPFYFFGENLSEEIDITRTLSSKKHVQDDYDARNSLLHSCIPGWDKDGDQPFSNMQPGKLALTAMAVFALQGAQLFILDEIFRQTSSADIVKWEVLLKGLAAQGCGIIIASHDAVPLFNCRWHLEKGHLTCD